MKWLPSSRLLWKCTQKKSTHSWFIMILMIHSKCFLTWATDDELLWLHECNVNAREAQTAAGTQTLSRFSPTKSSWIKTIFHISYSMKDVMPPLCSVWQQWVILSRLMPRTSSLMYISIILASESKCYVMYLEAVVKDNPLEQTAIQAVHIVRLCRRLFLKAHFILIGQLPGSWPNVFYFGQNDSLPNLKLVAVVKHLPAFLVAEYISVRRIFPSMVSTSSFSWFDALWPE